MDIAQNMTKDLLPVGTSIPFLHYTLSITKKIGEGYTSMVFMGKLDDTENGTPVAIKAIKSNRTEQDFSQEYMTLSTLNSVVFESLKDFPNADEETFQGYRVNIAPKFYGAATYESPGCPKVPFIVMEFVQGTAVDKLLEQEKTLPEQQALIIAWQFFYLLYVLHTKLKKTYSDIKIENLFWQEAQQGEKARLRVLDLGNLYELRENAFFFGNPLADIQRAAMILLRMLTGRSIAYRTSAFVEDLPKLFAQAELSWGVKRFLRKALHWREDERDTNVQKIVFQLSKLVAGWEMHDAEILTEVAQKLAKVEEKYALEGKPGEKGVVKISPQAEDARNLLGILEVRAKKADKMLDRYTEDLIRRAETILGLETQFNIGMEFLKGSSYENAREAFSKGLYSSDYPAKVRHYYYLASIAVDLKDQFSELRVPLSDVMDCMEKENFETAQKILANMDESIKRNQFFQALEKDCQVHLALHAAREAERMGDYEAAATHYEKSYQALMQMPEPEAIQLQETGDLRSRYVALLSMEETRGKARDLIQEVYTARKDSDINTVLVKLHSVWERQPDLPEIRSSMLEIYNEEIELHHFINAFKLAQEGSLIDDPMIWNNQAAVASALIEIQSFIIMGNYPQFVEKVAWLSQSQKEDALIQTVLSKLVNENFLKRSVGEFPEEFLRELDQLSALGLVDEGLFQEHRAIAQQAISFVPESRKRLIDNYMVTLSYINQIENLDPILSRLMSTEAMYLFDDSNRLDKSRELIYNARQLSLLVENYRSEEISSWEERLTERQETDMPEEKEASKVSAWREIEDSYTQLEMLYQKPPENENKSAYFEFLSFKGMKLLLAIIEYKAMFDPDNAAAEEVYIRTVKLMDIYKSGWLRVEQEASKYSQSLVEALNYVREAFYGGNINEAIVKLSELEHEYAKEDLQVIHAELNPKIARAKELVQLLDEKQVILESLDFSDTSFLDDINQLASSHEDGKLTIPRVYFSEPLKHYLERYREKMLSGLASADTYFDDPYDETGAFLQYTIQAKKAEAILKMIEEKNHVKQQGA